MLIAYSIIQLLDSNKERQQIEITNNYFFSNFFFLFIDKQNMAKYTFNNY